MVFTMGDVLRVMQERSKEDWAKILGPQRQPDKQPRNTPEGCCVVNPQTGEQLHYVNCPKHHDWVVARHRKRREQADTR